MPMLMADTLNIPLLIPAQDSPHTIGRHAASSDLGTQLSTLPTSAISPVFTFRPQCFNMRLPTHNRLRMGLPTLILFFLLPLTHAYIDLFNEYTAPSWVPNVPTPTPHQIRNVYGLQHTELPSMITAVAPSITMADNGTVETLYSMHYHDFFVKRNVGKGIFKRGVFESDPPIATCTPCGRSTAILIMNATTTGPTVSCTTHTYYGVFRSNVGPQSAATSSYCYDSNYSGALLQTSTYSIGLPCCFTIPASCLANYSSSFSISMTYSSGVFRTNSSIFSFSSTRSSSGVVSTNTASPSSSSGLSTAVSTSATVTSKPSATTLSKSTSAGLSSPVVSSMVVVKSSVPSLSPSTSPSGASTGISTTSSTSSSFGTSLSLAQSDVMSPIESSAAPSSTEQSAAPSKISSIKSAASSSEIITSVTVIASSTVVITISGPSSNSGALGLSLQPGDLHTSTSQVILSIITSTPSSRSPTIITTTVPNTVSGCGTASGSGVIIGTGTVYVGAGLIPVVSSGTVSGFASKVVGCGTLIASSGSFSGSATIIGCGSASGYATMTGSGTVWPAALGGLISFVSSGTVTGSGRVEGCGAITGSGTFTASHGIVSTTTIMPPPGTTTVEVYVSYCSPLSGLGLPRMGDNSTHTMTAVAAPSIFSLAMSVAKFIPSNETFENPLCNVCPNDEGTCCPLRMACNEGDGHCPWRALQGAGYVVAGLNVVAQRNSSGLMRI